MANEQYFLKILNQMSDIKHKLIKERFTNSNYSTKHCGTTDPIRNTSTTYSSANRFNREIHLPAGQSSSTYYVELYVVMDHSLYRRTGSIDATIMRAITMVHYASALYSQIDIYLALVGIEVWNVGNRIVYPADPSYPGEYSGDGVLSAFNKYRAKDISLHTPNDNAHLFTASELGGNTIGKGDSGSICTHATSCGVTYDDIPDNHIRAAQIMAHELGHNFGMEHTNRNGNFGEQDCTCRYPGNPDMENCIMHGSSDRDNPYTKWSQCNMDLLRNRLGANGGQCLKNKPVELEQYRSRPICGNFFVERGEECDCGPVDHCTSRCCDASTCRLLSNAHCSTGPCCDLSTCTLKPISTSCRPIQDRECDLEEFCDGRSEWCPSDKYKQDGTPCYNRGDAFCYEGKCNSHNSQCYFIWHRRTSRKASDECYRENGRGEYYGYCSWSPNMNADDIIYSRTYTACATDEDKLCGALFCVDDDTDVIAYRVPAIVNYPILRHASEDSLRNRCIIATFDVGFSERDPGMVPNGAKCGHEKMCINSTCTRVAAKPLHCNCNGRGICNQYNLCHCDVGWAPPYCQTRITRPTTPTTTTTRATRAPLTTTRTTRPTRPTTKSTVLTTTTPPTRASPTRASPTRASPTRASPTRASPTRTPPTRTPLTRAPPTRTPPTRAPRTFPIRIPTTPIRTTTPIPVHTTTMLPVVTTLFMNITTDSIECNQGHANRTNCSTKDIHVHGKVQKFGGAVNLIELLCIIGALLALLLIIVIVFYWKREDVKVLYYRRFAHEKAENDASKDQAELENENQTKDVPKKASKLSKQGKVNDAKLKPAKESDAEMYASGWTKKQSQNLEKEIKVKKDSTSTKSNVSVLKAHVTKTNPDLNRKQVKDPVSAKSAPATPKFTDKPSAAANATSNRTLKTSTKGRQFR